MGKARRAQTSIEYMLAVTMSLMLVAAIIVGGFRELELSLALGAARMGGGDFVSKNPYYSLGRMDYSVSTVSNTVNVSPVYVLHGRSAVTAQEQVDAANMSFVKLRQVFAPADVNQSADYCFNATYRRYCISPVLVPA